jgi:hypothetical protein
MKKNPSDLYAVDLSPRIHDKNHLAKSLQNNINKYRIQLRKQAMHVCNKKNNIPKKVTLTKLSEQTC